MHIVPPTGNAMNVERALVDFGFASGGEGDLASVTVPASWVQANSVISCTPSSLQTSDHDTIDAILDRLIAISTNIIPGVSFDIFVTALNGTWGRYYLDASGGGVV